MIEEYWYMQDHDDLRAAAAELLMNLLHCEEVCALFFNLEDRKCVYESFLGVGTYSGSRYG